MASFSTKMKKLAVKVSVIFTWVSWLSGVIFAVGGIGLCSFMMSEALYLDRPLYWDKLQCHDDDDGSTIQRYCEYFAKSDLNWAGRFTELYPENTGEGIIKEVFQTAYLLEASVQCTLFAFLAIYWIILGQWLLRKKEDETKSYPRSPSGKKVRLYFTHIAGACLALWCLFNACISGTDGLQFVYWVISGDYVPAMVDYKNQFDYSTLELKTFVQSINIKPWQIYVSEGGEDILVEEIAPISFKLSTWGCLTGYHLGCIVFNVISMLLVLTFMAWAHLKYDQQMMVGLIVDDSIEEQYSETGQTKRNRRGSQWTIEKDDKGVKRPKEPHVKKTEKSNLLNENGLKNDKAHYSWKNNHKELLPD